ncbi:RNA polymerase sigma factor [Saliterribacillus persicus]|uniref:RNA polymerase sigma-70 factor (ECF subfamily) n=1 Tax=Saliterribacillus persicus TaxID=930114 RepID=A0A368Y0U1_9BACI|nr:RNA polymerase sigma factor [Saliterribacillus persicus]RCW71874.1 RNA polymerase sigma-70 factor (ECF subfamily) [Saliterribacillus persicus]
MEKTLIDTAYFDEIYNSYHDRLYNTAFFILKETHLAHDALQEAFIKIFQNIDQLKKLAKPFAWMKTITTRTAIDLLRKEKRSRLVLLSESYSMDHFSLSDANEIDKQLTLCCLKKDMIDCFKNESEKIKVVFILRYCKDLSDEEIATHLDISLSAVKTRLFRARQIIRNTIDKKDFREITAPIKTTA